MDMVRRTVRRTVPDAGHGIVIDYHADVISYHAFVIATGRAGSYHPYRHQPTGVTNDATRHNGMEHYPR